MKKDVLIMFGGESAEHEVSIISGLQVVEKIDRDQFSVHSVYVGKNGAMSYLEDVRTRTDFLRSKRRSCSFGKDIEGGYVLISGLVRKKVRPYAAFLAFHGGTGESGHYQGLLEACSIPHTGSTVEGSVISMNKRLTNQVLASHDVSIMKGVSIFSSDVDADSLGVSKRVLAEVGVPCIVKPVHLGSSIAIEVIRREQDLEKALIQASRVDSEVLIEQLLTDFVEYNISVRSKEGKLQCSAIEKPHKDTKTQEDILSFADKYERGGKKTGNAGMASLVREVPARIPTALKERIENSAKRVYTSCRLAGVPRIDFMYKESSDELFVTEVNPIPGSLAFYLWEATGLSFTEQITDALQIAVESASTAQRKKIDYTSDIVQKFCA